MSNASGAQPTDTSGVRLFPPGIYIGGLVIGYIVQWLAPIPIVPGALSLATRVLGIAVVLAGLTFMFSALTLFRSVGTPVNPTEPTRALALTGPYRYTRNPMYLGMALLLVGFALIGNALWPLIAVLPVVWIIRTQVIDREERYLEARFGSEYTNFKSRVRRWL